MPACVIEMHTPSVQGTAASPYRPHGAKNSCTTAQLRKTPILTGMKPAQAQNLPKHTACPLVRQITDATDPTYLPAGSQRSFAGPAERSSGWLRGGFQDVLRRVSSIPGSLNSKD
ncbi:MAG: hypothetical protein FWE94_04810 [Coriobacteriia bacterium]|nr:hypothetical protein [Coriobacteriia bacterium]